MSPIVVSPAVYYQITVKGGATVTVDLAGVGAFAQQMATTGNTRQFSIKQV